MKKLTTFLPIIIGIFLSTLAAGPSHFFTIPYLFQYTGKTENTYSVATTAGSNNTNFGYNSFVGTEKQGQNVFPYYISSTIVKDDVNGVYMLVDRCKNNSLLEEANNRYNNYYIGVSLCLLVLELVYVLFHEYQVKKHVLSSLGKKKACSQLLQQAKKTPHQNTQNGRQHCEHSLYRCQRRV